MNYWNDVFLCFFVLLFGVWLIDTAKEIKKVYAEDEKRYGKSLGKKVEVGACVLLVVNFAYLIIRFADLLD